MPDAVKPLSRGTNGFRPRQRRRVRAGVPVPAPARSLEALACGDARGAKERRNRSCPVGDGARTVRDSRPVRSFRRRHHRSDRPRGCHWSLGTWRLALDGDEASSAYLRMIPWLGPSSVTLMWFKCLTEVGGGANRACRYQRPRRRSWVPSRVRPRFGASRT
jgi:hypothetical protein